MKRNPLRAVSCVIVLVVCTTFSGMIGSSSIQAESIGQSPTVRRSTSDLRVNGTKYLFKDCNAVDWCWQPVGTYRNVGKGTIKYLEVVYTISARGKSFKGVEKLRTTLKPRGTARILSGKNNRSFVLGFYDDDASTIGPLLGSTYVSWTHEVRYLKYSDGSTAGKKVDN